METILVVASALVIGTVVLVAGTVLVLRATLRRQLRVAVGRRSLAPTTWILPVGAAARLHLRLRMATARARIESAHPDCRGAGLDDVVGHLERYAIDVEHALVSAAKTPRATRRRLLQPVAADVAAIEERAQRVSTVAREWTATMRRDANHDAAAPLLGADAVHPLQTVDDRLAATQHGARVVRSPMGTQPHQASEGQPAPQPATQ